MKKKGYQVRHCISMNQALYKAEIFPKDDASVFLNQQRLKTSFFLKVLGQIITYDRIVIFSKSLEEISLPEKQKDNPMNVEKLVLHVNIKTKDLNECSGNLEKFYTWKISKNDTTEECSSSFQKEFYTFWISIVEDLKPFYITSDDFMIKYLTVKIIYSGSGLDDSNNKEYSVLEFFEYPSS